MRKTKGALRRQPVRHIVIVGSSNTDMTIALDRIPKPGETILGGRFAMHAGGKGANQAVGAARAGGDVAFIAALGKDVFGDRALAGFADDGINVNYVFRKKNVPSGVALIFVAKSGENSIAVAPGANASLTPADIIKARKVLTQAGVVVLSLEIPIATVQAAAEIASRAEVCVIINPAPARPLPPDLFKSISIITPNETEAEILTGIKVDNDAAAEKAARKLIRKGAESVIITLGARGAFLATGNFSGLIPGFKTRAVDTTAAGDIFNGALAVALAKGRPLADAVVFANAAAALSVGRSGAQPSAPTRDEIEGVLQRGRVIR